MDAWLLDKVIKLNALQLLDMSAGWSWCRTQVLCCAILCRSVLMVWHLDELLPVNQPSEPKVFDAKCEDRTCEAQSIIVMDSAHSAKVQSHNKSACKPATDMQVDFADMPPHLGGYCEPCWSLSSCGATMAVASLSYSWEWERRRQQTMSQGNSQNNFHIQ